MPRSTQLNKEPIATGTPEGQAGVFVVRRHHMLVWCSHWLSVPILLGLIFDLYILEKDGRQKLLAHESAIISKVPKRVRTVRIFTDTTVERREAIRERIKEVESTI